MSEQTVTYGPETPEYQAYVAALRQAVNEPGAWGFLDNIDLKAETDGAYRNDGRATRKGQK